MNSPNFRWEPVEITGARCAQGARFTVAAGASRRSRGEAAHARLRNTGRYDVTANSSTVERNVKSGAGADYYLGDAAPRLCARDCATTCGSTDSRESTSSSVLSGPTVRPAEATARVSGLP